MNLSLFIQDFYLPAARRSLKPRSLVETVRLINRHIRPLLGDTPVKLIGPADVEKLHRRLEDTPVQANRAHAALSAIMTTAMRNQLIASNPCTGTRLNRETPKERFLSKAETDALCRVLITSGDIRAKFVYLLLLTGARPGELRDARREWVQGSVLRLPDAKRGPRPIYLSPPALSLILWLPARSDGRLFPERMGMQRGWDKFSEAAGFKGVRLYDLRHTFASAALGAGVGLDVVGRLLGHRKAQTTLRYAHLAPEVALDAAAKVAAQFGGGE